MKIVFLILLFLMLALQLWGQTTHTWAGGDGQWNTGMNWTSNSVPGPGDTVIIGNATTGTDIARLTTPGGTTTIDTLIVENGGALEVFAGTLIVQNNITIDGDISIVGGVMRAPSASPTNSSFSGLIQVTGGGGRALINLTPDSPMVDNNTGTVVLTTGTGDFPVRINAQRTYDGLFIMGGNFTPAGPVTVANTLSISATASIDIGGNDITVGGDIGLSGATPIVSSTGSLILNGTSLLRSNATNTIWPNIVIGTTTSVATITTDSNLTIGGTLTVGTADPTSLNMEGDTITLRGNLDFSNLDTLDTDSMSEFQFNTTADLELTSGVVQFPTIRHNATGTLTIMGDITLGNDFIFDVSETAGNLIVNGNVTLNGSGTHDFGANVSLNNTAGTTFTTAGNLIFGTNDANVLTLNGGAILITDGLASRNLTINSSIEGSQDLTLNFGGTTTIVEGVGSLGNPYGLPGAANTILTIESDGDSTFQGDTHLGSGGTASLNITGSGNVTFEDLLAVDSIIEQSNTAGTITFQNTVGFTGPNTSTLNGSVVLDGALILTTGDLILGNDHDPASTSLDTVTLRGGLAAITSNATATSVTINAAIQGSQNIRIRIPGTTRIRGEVGTPLNALGTGMGTNLQIESTGNTIFERAVRLNNGSTASINVLGSGNVTFQDTLNAASAIRQVDTAGTITFQDDVTLSGASDSFLDGDVTINKTALLPDDNMSFTSEGDLTFGNTSADIVTINGSDTTFVLNNNGNATFPAEIRTTTTGLDLNINSGTTPGTGGTIILNAIGEATNRFRTLTITAYAIVLQSDIYTTNSQGYFTEHTSGNDGGTRLDFGLSGVISTNNTGMRFDDLYILATGPPQTIAIENTNEINTDRFVFYEGSLQLNGATIDASDDITIFGAAYNVNDPERIGGDHWAYPETADLRYNPAPAPYSASFGTNAIGLAGATLDGAASFYVNGTDINPGMTWNLTLPPTPITPEPLTNTPWGSSYGIMLNTNVAYCNVTNNTIIAANTVTGTTIGASSVIDLGNNDIFSYNTITPPGNGDNYASVPATAVIDSYGLDTGRTFIQSAETVKSDLIKITFNRPILNSANEIHTSVMNGNIDAGNTGIGNGIVDFESTWLDGDRRAISQQISTNDDPDSGRAYYALSEFYIKLPPTASWRTDATGLSLGGTNSTDDEGRMPNGSFSNIVPEISFAKGSFFGSNGADLVTAKNPMGLMTIDDLNTYSEASDGTGPVLHTILVGRNGDTGDETANHNYFKLQYSENVAFGDLNGSALPPTTLPGLDYGDSGTFVNASTNSFEANQSGGEIVDDNGTIQVNGLFSYSNNDYRANTDYHMLKGSRDPNSNIDLIRKTAENELEITLAARQSGPTWAGWVFNVLDPYAAPTDGINGITVLPNLGVTDAAGNAIDNIESTETIRNKNNSLTLPGGGGTRVLDFTPDTVATDYWDVSAPGISAFSAPANTHPLFNNRLFKANNYEIVTRDSNSDQLIDTLDFFIQDNLFNRSWDFARGEDNSQLAGTWSPATGHPDTRQSPNTGGTLISPPRGLRDSTVDLAAFRVASIEDPITGATVLSTISGVFSTQIINNLFQPANPNIINDPDDQYFSINFDGTVRNWDPTSSLYITYDAAASFATDLAGNLMPSSGYTPTSVFTSPVHPNQFTQNPYTENGVSGRLATIERTPPEILLALGAVDGSRIYLKFTEPIFGNQELTEEVAATDFTFSGGNITGIEIISDDDGGGPARGITEMYLNVSPPLTAETLIDTTISGASWDSIWDRGVNPYDPIDTPLTSLRRRRITDVLIGVIDPVWATDGIQTNENRNAGFAALRVFDGTGRLSDRDITIESSLRSSSHADLPVNLYYDAEVPDANRTSPQIGFWSVFDVPGLVTAISSPREARQLRDNGTITQHLIPGGDEEIRYGTTLEFLYSIGNRMAAWTDNPNDPLNLRSWSFRIGQLLEQRGTATILNNVINPGAGDSAVLHYELKQPGFVIANVFTLDGDLVRVLLRERAGEGTYNLIWDGNNSTGDEVAGGFYIIRLVAPNIDESRKVLVVK